MKSKTLNFKYLAFFAFSTFVLISSHKHYKKTRGFCHAYIESPLVKSSLVCDLSEEAREILKQKFYYLASGRQAFVFESEDKRYVLKLLSTKRFENNKNQALLKKEIESYQLAHHFLKSESAILGMKLGPMPERITVTLYDPLGIKKMIDLSSVDFIIQPKAITLAKIFRKQPQSIQSHLAGAKTLVKNRLSLDICDKDPRIHRNMGLVGTKPIFIDLGAFYISQSEKDKDKEMNAIFDYNNTYLKSQNLRAVNDDAN